MSALLVWVIAAATLAAILLRPKQWKEAVWACLGAAVLVLARLIPAGAACRAVLKGTDVYLFLAGMMLLSELGRREGVFNWLASLAVAAARGSRARLFLLIYGVGIAVTIFLSNDATAVVLTPAVYAAVRKARAPALPYLLICAFIANAASFVLPIANPANLVVYGKELPPLVPWLRVFLLPSVLAIAATFAALRWVLRDELHGEIEDTTDAVALSLEGKFAAWSIAGTGAVLIGASAVGLDLGLPTCITGVVAVLLVTRARRKAIRRIVSDVAWSVLPLVAGLFVIVEALERAGGLNVVARGFAWCAGLPRAAGALAASFGISALSNLMNNLPSGLLAGGALHSAGVPAYIRDAVLVGVDLGPNLSVTGSLATILWLIALRREGEHITGWEFLKIGLIVMPGALLLATMAVALVSGR